MNLKIKTVAQGSEDYTRMIDLRLRVLRIPLGLTFSPEMLAAEANDTHLVAFEGERLVGCLLLTEVSPLLVKMRQVAVEPDQQGRGVGRAMVAFAERLAAEQGYATMTLNAREIAVPFYLRQGYEIVSEPFIEVTLPHRTMLKRLYAAGSREG